MQVIELYAGGFTDMEVDYKKKTGEAGKIRILLTDAEQEYLDEPCPRCNGTGKNGKKSVLGYPENPCYYCSGTGKRPLINVQTSDGLFQPTPQPKPVDGELQGMLDRLFCTHIPAKMVEGQVVVDIPTRQELESAISAHLQAAVRAERERWQTASMKRLAKYDETGVPPETQALIDRAVAEAETNAVAWTVSVLDDLHNLGSYSVEEDRLYKGAKNTIRIRFEEETGIDPAPHYPVTAKLQQLKQEGK